MVRAVATAYPEAQITVLGHPKRAEIFENLPFISHVSSITKKTAPWRGWFSRKHYDLAFVVGFDEPLVTYGIRVAKHVIAFEQKNVKLNQRLDISVPKPASQSEHAILQLLRLPVSIGIPSSGLRIRFRVTDEERLVAQCRLKTAGISLAHPLIGLQVASFPTKSYRDWPINYFSNLCERISNRRPKAHFLIFGGPEEKEKTDWLKEKLGNKASLFAGHLTLRETAALMSLTDLYVGVDTGPTHIMSAFNIPLIGLFHCISPSAMTGPLEHPCAYLIDHPLGHSAEMADMGDISIDTVFFSVERALREHPPTNQ